MTKLDLSALKKQKPAGEAAPAVAAIPSVVTAESAPIVAIPVATAPAAVRETTKAADAPAKPKLSLSSFKKPGSEKAAAPTMVPSVFTETVAIEPEPVIETVVEPVEAVTMEVPSVQEVVATMEVPVEMPVETVIADVPETTSADVSMEVSAPVVESAQSIVEAKVTEASSSAEFFPNLALENDNLFSDIVGMGSFEEEKPEEPMMEAEPDVSSVMAELEQIASDAAAAADAPAVLAPIAETPSFEAMMTSSEPIAAMEESATAPAAPSATPVEYVATVAKELSKDRKGGLSELFDKKYKVLYGVSALVVASIGVVGSLYGFGVLDGSKANVVESRPPAVAKVEKPTAPVTEKSEAEKPVVESVPVATTNSGVTVASGTGVEAPTGGSGATVAPTVTTVAPAAGNVNTLRTPNVRKKRAQ